MSPVAEQPFLDAMLAKPSDDGPREIYADFLETSGDPADAARAEFVRVQLALARLPAIDPRAEGLSARQSELLARHRAAWTAPARGLAAGIEFRRGLPDAAAVDAEVFCGRGPDLFRALPIRRVRLLDAAVHLDRLATCPHLARVRDLDLAGGGLGSGGLNVLLRSPHLYRVEHLDLSFNGLCDSAVARLADAPTLPALRSLSLTDNGPITGEGLVRLAASPLRSGLISLDVSANEVTAAGIWAVARSPHLTRLKTLRVQANPLGDAGVAAFARSPLFAR